MTRCQAAAGIADTWCGSVGLCLGLVSCCVVLYYIVLASASAIDWYIHTFVGILVITRANKIHISRYKHRDSKGLCLGHWLIQAQCNFCLHQHNYKYKMHLDCYQILAHCRLQHLLTLVYAAAWKRRSKKRPKCTEGVGKEGGSPSPTIFFGCLPFNSSHIPPPIFGGVGVGSTV